MIPHNQLVDIVICLTIYLSTLIINAVTISSLSHWWGWTGLASGLILAALLTYLGIQAIAVWLDIHDWITTHRHSDSDRDKDLATTST